MSNQEQLHQQTGAIPVVKFGRLEELLSELAELGNYPQPINSYTIRVNEYSTVEPVMNIIERHTARIIVTAMENSGVGPVYLWIGYGGSFDEVNGHSHTRIGRAEVALALEENIHKLQVKIEEFLGVKVKTGMFMVPAEYLKGNGVTDLVDLLKAFRRQPQAQQED